MCDQDQMQRWAKGQLSRREFGVMTGAAALASCTPADVHYGEFVDENGNPLTGVSYHSIETPDGTIDAAFVKPLSGKHPGVIMWPDIASLRQSKIDMAFMLAAKGFAVLVMNPYYRDVLKNQFEDFADFIANNGFTKVAPWRAKLSADAIRRDTQAIVEWLDQQPFVDTARGIGAEGYCMGGAFALYSAAAVPSRVKAAASFHGGGLVREDAESPHKLMATTEASFLIAIAQDDDAEAPDDKTALREAADAADRPAVVEVFAGDHGWTVPDSPAFAKEEADRAFAAKIKLYESAL